MSNTILEDRYQYSSPFGWRISLPPDWHIAEQDSEDGAPPEVPAPVVVFYRVGAPSNNFSWMVSRQIVDKELAAEFITLSMLEGPVANDEIVGLLPRTFPVIGEIDRARIIAFNDGNRGLEVLETFAQGNEKKKGYQLISLLRKGGELFFQRIAFYAAIPVFENLIGVIQASALSFEYYRTYSFEQLSQVKSASLSNFSRE